MRHGNRRARRDCCVIPSVSRRPRRFVCPRPTPEKARPHHTARNRATSPTTGGRPARVTRDSASFSNQDGIFLQGSLYPRRNRISRPYLSGVRSLALQGVRQAPQIARVRNCRDVPYKATLERKVRDILRSVQGQSRVPRRGIPSRESIEPSNPTEWVRAPPSEPSRALYETCLWTTSRPLSNGARTSA